MASASKSKEKSKSTVWTGQEESLKTLYGRADDLYKQGPYEYGEDRVEGFDPAQEEALGLAEARGRGGSDLTRAAQGEAQRTLEGEYLDPEKNQFLQRYSDIGARNMRRDYYGTINSLGSRLESAGRTGSGAHATGTQVAGENLATGMGDFQAKLYGGAYEGERGRMMGAMEQSNYLANQDYRDYNALMSAGQQRQQQRQSERDDMVERFKHDQYAMAEKLAEFSSMIGDPVSTSTAKGKASSWGAL
jgi:hypothetical protein